MVNILIKKEINKSEVENKEEDFTISSEVLWKYFLTRINLKTTILDETQKKTPVNDKEKITMMKDSLNQNYEIFTSNLTYEMIEFGINNNLPIGKHTN